MKKNSSAASRNVGELAAATGLTVRTLHYYEEIGLLIPAGRTEAGHRLYSGADVERLYRVCLLRRLGLPLTEIGRALDDPAWNLPAAMGAYLRKLEDRLDGEGRLRSRLAAVLASIDSNESRSTSPTATASTARATPRGTCGPS